MTRSPYTCWFTCLLFLTLSCRKTEEPPAALPAWQREAALSGPGFFAARVEGERLFLINEQTLARFDGQAASFEQLPAGYPLHLPQLAPGFVAVADYDTRLGAGNRRDSLVITFFPTAPGLQPARLEKRQLTSDAGRAYELPVYATYYQPNNFISVNRDGLAAILLYTGRLGDPATTLGGELALVELEFGAERSEARLREQIPLGRPLLEVDPAVLRAAGGRFFVASSRGGRYTLVLDEGGLQRELPTDNPVFAQGDRLWQWRAGGLYRSPEGLNWLMETPATDGQPGRRILAVDDLAVDFSGEAGQLRAFRLPDAAPVRLHRTGLPPGARFFFLTEFAGRVYAGLTDGNVYSIDREDLREGE